MHGIKIYSNGTARCIARFQIKRALLLEALGRAPEENGDPMTLNTGAKLYQKKGHFVITGHSHTGRDVIEASDWLWEKLQHLLPKYYVQNGNKWLCNGRN